MLEKELCHGNNQFVAAACCFLGTALGGGLNRDPPLRDRFLPHGWYMLPPLQTCDKGNACLTCSVFVTDDSHQPALERQLAETAALIDRSTTAFQQRHGRPMPEDNVWLLQRRAEHTALTRLLETIGDKPNCAVQGAGCGTAPAGPVPLALDRDHHRRARP